MLILVNQLLSGNSTRTTAKQLESQGSPDELGFISQFYSLPPLVKQLRSITYLFFNWERSLLVLKDSLLIRLNSLELNHLSILLYLDFLNLLHRQGNKMSVFNSLIDWIIYESSISSSFSSGKGSRFIRVVELHSALTDWTR